MSRVGSDLLARCLDDVSAGRRTPAECAAAHPAVADDLRSLLEVAQAIAPAPEMQPSPAFRAQGRAALLTAIATPNGHGSPNGRLAAPSVTHPTTWRLLGWTLLGGRPFWTIGPAARAVAVGALVVALVLAIGGGVVFAAQEAIPGDPLYGIKLEVENVEVALAPNAAAKAEIYLGLMRRRLAEIQAAERRERLADAAAAARELARDVQLAEGYRRAAGHNQGLDARFAAELSAAQAALQAGVLASRSDPALVQALDAVDQEIVVVGGPAPAGGSSPTVAPALSAIPSSAPIAKSTGVATRGESPTAEAAQPTAAILAPGAPATATTAIATPTGETTPDGAPTGGPSAPTAQPSAPTPAAALLPTVVAPSLPVATPSPAPSVTAGILPLPTAPLVATVAPVLPSPTLIPPTAVPVLPTAPALPTVGLPSPTIVPLPTLAPATPTPVKLPTLPVPSPTLAPLPTLVPTVPVPTKIPTVPSLPPTPMPTIARVPTPVPTLVPVPTVVDPPPTRVVPTRVVPVPTFASVPTGVVPVPTTRPHGKANATLFVEEEAPSAAVPSNEPAATPESSW